MCVWFVAASFVQDFAAPVSLPCGFIGNGEGSKVREGKGAESVSDCHPPSQIDAADGASQAQGNESPEGHFHPRNITNSDFLKTIRICFEIGRGSRSLLSAYAPSTIAWWGAGLVGSRARPAPPSTIAWWGAGRARARPDPPSTIAWRGGGAGRVNSR